MRRLNRFGRCSVRPVVAVLAALSVMGGGLAAGAQATDTTAYSQINGGGGQPAASDDGLITPAGTTTPAATPSPTTTPQSPAAATQPTTTTATPTPLSTPNPLTTGQTTTATNTGAQAPGPQARTGSHTVTFTSQPDTQGMPASQTIPDGKTATWPHDDPTRPGWTFNGWFVGDLAYDFTKPITTDLTLTAKWSKWGTSTDTGPWQGGTDVKIDTPGGHVRYSQISTSNLFSLALGSDGNLYGWGWNYNGQVAVGGKGQCEFCDPQIIAMPEGVKFTQVSAGYSHAAALDRDGRIWTWGENYHNSLGRPLGDDSSVPGLVIVPEGVKFTAVSAAFDTTMALDSNGQVWTWGFYDTATPHKVDLFGGTVFTDIFATSNPGKIGYTALDTDGRIWTWTWNFNGYHPVLVDTDVRFKAYNCEILGSNCIAIARDGTVWTWGSRNDGGQLGRIPDSANPADKPGRVPGLSGATQVSISGNAIRNHGFAMTDTGTWAWGWNQYGELGTGTKTEESVSAPTRVVPPAGAPADFHYISFANSSTHTLLIGSDGEAYAFGSNKQHQLGIGGSDFGDHIRPGLAWRPVDQHLTSVLFGEARNIGGPYRKSDGWHATSPRHSLGTVTLTIQYTYKGIREPDETSHRFTYTGDTTTVTFKSEHGSPTPPQQVIVGDTARRPDDPTTDDGWTFNGWFQGDKPYDFTKPVTGNTTLTARWGRWGADPAQGPWRGGTDVRIDTPTSRVRFAQVSAGQSHSLAVGSDGNLYTWGGNQYGQLGDGTTTNRTAATMVAAPAGKRFVQVAAGSAHSMALDRDGTVWTWGSNEKEQLGRTPDDNNPAGKPGPIASPASVTFIAISAGADHSTALDRDGNIWTWGDNQYQQLGFPTSTGSHEAPAATPTGVGVPEAAFASVSAGASHSIGLDANGTAWTWGGRDTTGATSDDDLLGHTDYKPAPVDTTLRFMAITAGADHSVGVARDGTVYTWGHNENGQLGRTPASAEPAGRPGPVPGPSGATGVSAGRTHSVALTGSGAWAWGGNQYGQLGTTTGNGTSDGVTPARVPNPKGAPSGFAYTAAAAGADSTLAVGSDGDVYAAGANGTGQLGTGTTATTAHPSPAMVWRPAGSPVTGVLFGAKPSAGEVRRRADGWHAASPRHRPETVTLTIRSAAGTSSAGPEDADQSEDTSLRFMYTGDMSTLTFTSQHGRTPDAQQVPAGEPTRRPADPAETGWTFDGWFNGDVAYDFTAPLEHDLTVTGRWHRTGRWVLSPDHGSEHGDETVTLTAPAAPDIRLASIDTGGTSTLGIGSDGGLYAWGSNTNGQLGDGTTSQHATPTRVSRPDGTGDGFVWVQAAAGRTHSAAVGSDGQLYTWGDNTHGQLGDGTTTRRTRPVKVSRPDGTDTGFTWTRAVAGDGYTMALGSDDNLYAWGALTGGLGDAARTTGSSRPVRVALPQDAPAAFRYEQIAAGDTHAAAIGSDGNLYTWGDNTHGQLGHDNTGTPTAAATAGTADPQQPAGYIQASAGGSTTLAIDRQGRLWAWGRLADGTDTATPTRIRPAGTADTYRFTHTSTGRNHSAATGQDHRTWTWGDNTSGQLGHNTGTPGIPTVITGLNTTLTASGGDTTIAIDTNGDTQAWGDNTNGQAGHGDTNPVPAPRAAAVPPQPTPAGLAIDNDTLPLRQTGPGTWQATTTAHAPGTLPVRVRWTLAGQPQPDDTTNTYTYRHTGSLPNAGGAGIILLITAGALGIATGNACRRRRTTITTSHE